MKQDEFDLRLMEDVAQLPPPPEELGDYTPWQSAMTKLLWGMALTTFRFSFFFLQYLLPLTGAVLVYLGCRTLRRENRWFRACGGLAGLYLLCYMAALLLNATPVMASIAQSRPLSLGTGTLISLLPMGILFSLRQGTQSAFSRGDGTRPRDYLGRALLAYGACMAIALWCDLVPLTSDSEGPISFGPVITDKPLYYGRTIAFAVLYILVLWFTAKQSGALAGRGYQITPAPVRLPGRVLLLLVLAVMAATVPAACLASGRLPLPEARQTAALTPELEGQRDRLAALGMDLELASLLDGAELERCAGALEVVTLLPERLYAPQDIQDQTNVDSALFALNGGSARLYVQAVLLPGRQARLYQVFCWEEEPRLSLQESFTAYLDYYPSDDFSAGLAWSRDGVDYLASLPVFLGGGQRPEQLPAWALDWYRGELKALGHLRYVPYVVFSLPRGSREVTGWLAWTADYSRDADSQPSSTYLMADPILRHQTSWFMFPFQSVEQWAATTSFSNSGPFRSVCGSFCRNLPQGW